MIYSLLSSAYVHLLQKIIIIVVVVIVILAIIAIIIGVSVPKG